MTRPLRVVAWPADSNKADQPYNWLLSRSLRLAGVEVQEFSPRRVLERPDVWHLHWPDALLNDTVEPRVLKNLIGLAGLLEAAHRRGTAIVWTVHNLASHDQLYPRIEPAFWQLLIRRVDGYISLSETALTAAIDRFPALRSKPGAVVPIGHYRGIYPDDLSVSEARDRLGIPDSCRVIAFVGQIRPYKGVAGLIQRFREVPGGDIRLVVAGRPNSAELDRSLRSAAGDDDRIILRLGFVPDDEIQLYMRSADLVALPFLEILNSASAMLALSFNRPVLVPSRGSMAELQRVVGDDWVRVYDGSLTSAELAQSLAWATQHRSAAAPLTEFDWDTIGRLTAHAYERTRAYVDRGRR